MFSAACDPNCLGFAEAKVSACFKPQMTESSKDPFRFEQSQNFDSCSVFQAEPQSFSGFAFGTESFHFGVSAASV